jgi:uncharacterized membrane protein
MKLNAKTGATLAATAAFLVINAMVPATPAAADSKVKCYGVNACKGKSACHTAANACAGQNACKGKGYLLLEKDECLEKGGKLTES